MGYCEVSFGYDALARPLHEGWILMKGARSVFNYNYLLDSLVISPPGRFITVAVDLDEKMRRSNNRAVANHAPILTERLVRTRKSTGVCGICGQDATHMPVETFTRSVGEFLYRK